MISQLFIILSLARDWDSGALTLSRFPHSLMQITDSFSRMPTSTRCTLASRNQEAYLGSAQHWLWGSAHHTHTLESVGGLRQWDPQSYRSPLSSYFVYTAHSYITDPR